MCLKVTAYNIIYICKTDFEDFFMYIGILLQSACTVSNLCICSNVIKYDQILHRYCSNKCIVIIKYGHCSYCNWYGGWRELSVSVFPRQMSGFHHVRSAFLLPMPTPGAKTKMWEGAVDCLDDMFVQGKSGSIPGCPGMLGCCQGSKVGTVMSPCNK